MRSCFLGDYLSDMTSYIFGLCHHQADGENENWMFISAWDVEFWNFGQIYCSIIHYIYIKNIYCSITYYIYIKNIYCSIIHYIYIKNIYCSIIHYTYIKNMYCSIIYYIYIKNIYCSIIHYKYIKNIYNRLYIVSVGPSGGADGWGTALQVGRSRIRLPTVSLEFFNYIILPAALWPWDWLSL